jgi:hypothetical protein
MNKQSAAKMRKISRFLNSSKGKLAMQEMAAQSDAAIAELQKSREFTPAEIWSMCTIPYGPPGTLHWPF